MELVLLIYIILLCGFLPLYMNSGYFMLGEAKALCYLIVSIPFAVILIIGQLVSMWKARREAKENEIIEPERPISIAEFFLYGTLFSCIISFAFSVDKGMAFFGYEGWRNGLLTMLVALTVCIVIGKKGFFRSFILILFFIIPFFEFGLAILNRMSIYPFYITGQNPSFLATLGNINWFSGFLAVWVPLGVGCMYVQKRFSWRFWLAGIYTLAGLIALFLQGSDGAALIVVACYGLLTWISLDDRECFKSFLIQLMVLGLSMTVVDILMIFAESAYSYDNNLLVEVCRSHAGIIMVAAAFFIYRVSRLFEVIKVSFYSRIYKWIFGILFAAGVAVGVFFFVTGFGDDFGNGRGIIWRMCTEIYMGLTPWQKLVGIGQDCLDTYAMNDPYWSSSFNNVFGGAVLTNAHCEILTVLIERGLVGAITYLGLFIAIILQLVKCKEKEPAAIICALPIISYFVYDQISFMQVTSMPYCFVLIGIAISLTKIRNSN